MVEADRVLSGGLDVFAPAQQGYSEDEHLFRVGFMSVGEAGELRGRLLSMGMPEEAVTVERMDQPVPAWLRRGEVDGHRAVWLAGREPGGLVPPLQGVMVRGSSRLWEVVESMRARGEVAVRRGPADPIVDEAGGERFEVVRGDALVDLHVIRASDGSGGVGLWAARRQERNRGCRSDIELLRRLKVVLEAAGS
ncbi:hypothetical protein FAF44_10685 [Nonomuraea sp. MG754425]|nr:hypothetical protein [Nonomuraea sp. MG754425]